MSKFSVKKDPRTNKSFFKKIAAFPRQMFFGSKIIPSFRPFLSLDHAENLTGREKQFSAMQFLRYLLLRPKNVGGGGIEPKIFFSLVWQLAMRKHNFLAILLVVVVTAAVVFAEERNKKFCKFCLYTTYDVYRTYAPAQAPVKKARFLLLLSSEFLLGGQVSYPSLAGQK